MKEIKIEHLAYLLKDARDRTQPKPIFFLGAGCSRSGNIPLASEIIKHILKDYSENQFIKELPIESRTYAKLMDCLLPAHRDELLKGYVNEAKINVTHIYLAQLIKEGYVDYVLTVNFDNLMLRALSLYNIFPATYDLAILKDLTTTTFNKKSVVYLHGQHHGLWLLNTPEELKKEIINLIISDKYQEDVISSLAVRVKGQRDDNLQSLLSHFYNNWGTHLGDLAKTKDVKEAEALYQLSFEKYQKAIEIKPDKHEAYNNWGTYLGDLAKTKDGKEAEELYQLSFEKYQKAIELGVRCYNLACWYALQKNNKEAFFYLDLSLSKKEITAHFVEKDDDWKSYLQDMDFINILNKYR